MDIDNAQPRSQAFDFLHLLASASEHHATMLSSSSPRNAPAHTKSGSDGEHTAPVRQEASAPQVPAASSRPQRAAAQRAAEVRRVFIENKDGFPDISELPSHPRAGNTTRQAGEKSLEGSILRPLPSWALKSLPFMNTSMKSPNIRKAMWFFLDRLIREDSNEYFFEPVDEEEVPGYSKMVKYPMDFSTMRNKLNSGQYTTIQNFWDDYMAIFRNCLSVNQVGTTFYVEAERQLKFGNDLCQLVQDRLDNLRKLYVRCAREKSIPPSVQALVFSRFVEGAHTVSWKNRRISNSEASSALQSLKLRSTQDKHCPPSKVHRGDCLRCPLCEHIRKQLVVWSKANVSLLKQKVLERGVHNHLLGVIDSMEYGSSDQDVLALLLQLRFLPPPCACPEGRPCCIKPSFWRQREERVSVEHNQSSTSVFPPVSGGLENLVQQPEGKTDCDVTTAAHRPPVVKQLADPFPVFDVAFALFSSVLTKFNERFMTVDTAYLVNRMLERLGDAIFREDEYHVLQQTSMGRRKNSLYPPHVDWDHIKAKLASSSYSLPSFWADFTVLLRSSLLTCKLLPDAEINSQLLADARVPPKPSSPAKLKRTDSNERLQSSTAYLYLPRSSHGKGYVAGDSEFFNRTSEFLASNPTKSQAINFVKKATHEDLMTLWQKQLWDISALISGNDKARTRRLAKDKCIPVILGGLKRIYSGERVSSDDEHIQEGASSSSPGARSNSKNRLHPSKSLVKRSSAPSKFIKGKEALKTRHSDSSSKPKQASDGPSVQWNVTAPFDDTCYDDVRELRADSIFRASEACRLYGLAMERLWTAICLLSAHLSSPAEPARPAEDSIDDKCTAFSEAQPGLEHEEPSHIVADASPLIKVKQEHEEGEDVADAGVETSPQDRGGDVCVIPDEDPCNEPESSTRSENTQTAEQENAANVSAPEHCTLAACTPDGSPIQLHPSVQEGDADSKGTPEQIKISDLSDREVTHDAPALSTEKRKRRKRNEIQQLRAAASSAGSSSNLLFDMITSRRSHRKGDHELKKSPSPTSSPCAPANHVEAADVVLQQQQTSVTDEGQHSSGPEPLPQKDDAEADDEATTAPMKSKRKRGRSHKTDESSGLEDGGSQGTPISLKSRLRHQKLSSAESDLPPPPPLPPPLPVPMDTENKSSSFEPPAPSRTPDTPATSSHIASTMSPSRKTPRVLRNRAGGPINDGPPLTKEVNDIAPGIKSVVCGPLSEEGCARAAPYVRRPFTLLDSFSRHLDCMVTQQEPARYRLHSALLPTRAVQPAKRLLRLEGADQDLLERQYDDMKNTMQCLRLGKSSAHAVGVFAPHRYPAGSMVFEYVGEVIQPPVADLREPKYRKERLGDYFFRISETEIIDATKKANKARFVNHSCDPNCSMTIITIRNKSKIVCLAARDIEESQEITYDYKFEREEVKIPCFCGTARCRGTLN